MRGEVLRQHSEKVSRIILADSDTWAKRGPVQFLDFADSATVAAALRRCDVPHGFKYDLNERRCGVLFSYYFIGMEIFLWIGGKECGPFSLRDVYDMKQTAGLGADTLAWTAGESEWRPLSEFLANHPVALPRQTATKGSGPERRKTSRLGGIAGAFVGAVGSAALVAGIAALTGALFTFLWWAIAWASGSLAKTWGRTADQLNGLFAFLATIVGIFVSGIGLAAVSRPVFVFGGLGVLISLPGSLWFAFRTGSRPSGP
jgi:hypothetical protein